MRPRVLGDNGEIDLLVTGGVTPHIFRMRPSDFKKVVEADVLFYVSPKFETFLKTTSLVNRASLNTIALAEQEDIKLYPYRDSKVWFADDEGLGGHDHSGMDLHIWLDPGNTRRIVEIIKDTLSELDPTNSVDYARNARNLINDLYKQEELIREQLRPLRDSAMIVYHDAFQYYERAFSLRSMGAIELSPDKPPSVKHIAALKKIAEERNVTCVLTIPGTHPKIAMTVIGNTNAGYGVVDHLGQYLDAGPDTYMQILSEITKSILECHKPADTAMLDAS